VNDLVSVIMPVYNVERYVEEAIRSVQCQSYNNIEIVVIDDGSSDATFSIVKDLAKFDDRIRLYKNSENLGIVKTLNRALSLARGEFILRMDGDDVSAENRLEVLMDYIRRNPEYGLVGSAYSGINEDGSDRGSSLVPNNQILIDKIILLTSPVSHIWLARKDVYKKLNGYRADTVEDYDFLLRMHSEKMLFTNVTDVLYKVRMRNGNTASTQGVKQAKAHIYVKSLYKERLSTGIDSYSEDAFKLAVESSMLMDYLHSKSQNLLSRALSSGIIAKVFFTFFAALLSPYTLSYLLNRYKYKSLIKRYVN
jgi:glycosyltransferase involved in cell wall biosynthesis